jgi:hypothetical protein
MWLNVLHRFRVTNYFARCGANLNSSCYYEKMIKERSRWRGDQGRRALRRLMDIQASVAALADEDLLDLADIFADEPNGPLGELARAEMRRRDISF